GCDGKPALHPPCVPSADGRALRSTIRRPAPVGRLPRCPASPAGLRRAAAVFGSSALDSSTGRHISTCAIKSPKSGDHHGGDGRARREENADDKKSRSTTAEVAAVGERPAANRDRLRRTGGNDSSRGGGAASPGGPGPDLVLP